MPSTPLKAADGSLLSDLAVVSRWKQHFCNLLNRPLHDPPDVLVAEAEAAIRRRYKRSIFWTTHTCS